MSVSFCNQCQGTYNWHWQEAFFKISCWSLKSNTCCVESLLARAGYRVHIAGGRKRNVIRYIKMNGIDQIPTNARIGHNNPQEYLPPEIVTILDKAFPTEWPYVYREP